MLTIPNKVMTDKSGDDSRHGDEFFWWRLLYAGAATDAAAIDDAAVTAATPKTTTRFVSLAVAEARWLHHSLRSLFLHPPLLLLAPPRCVIGVIQSA